MSEWDDWIGAGANSINAGRFFDFARCFLLPFSLRLHVASELREIFSLLQNSMVGRLVEWNRSMIFTHSVRVRRVRPSASISNLISSLAEGEEV